MSDLWDDKRDRALLAAWRAEIVAAGRVEVDDSHAPLLDRIVILRALLLDLAALAHGVLLEPGNAIHVQQAGCFVQMARCFRALGLTRRDVRRLDLGRRRPRRDPPG